MNFEKINRIKALIIKEFYQIIRDPSSILIAFIFPLILLFIYGVGISLDMDNLKVGVHLEDTNSDPLSFYLSLRDSKYFSTTISKNKKDLEKKIIQGDIKGIVTIPFYFSEFLQRPIKQAPIYVVADGSSPNTASFVQNYVEAAWLKWRLLQSIDKLKDKTSSIQIEPRIWFNEELNSRYFLVPGSIAIIMTLIGSLLTSLVISREWERGTMEALMATPVTMREIYIAKMCAYFFLGIFSMIICSLVSFYLFQVPFRGSVFVLFIVSSTFLLTALGTGMLISSFTKNQFLSSQISIIVSFLPAFMLSGFIFEIASMPFIIRLVTYIMPARYMVSNLQTLFLVGNIWPLIGMNTLIMLIFALVFFLFIFLLRSKKRLDV